MQLLELVQTTILCTVKVGGISTSVLHFPYFYGKVATYLDKYHWVPTIFLFGKFSFWKKCPKPDMLSQGKS